MRRIIITAALIALFNPISAAALQTEVDVQGITKMDERLERAKLEARREARAEARAAAVAVAQVVTDGVEEVAGGIAGLIRSVFGAYGDKAVSVASCESGLDPNAVNPSGAAGLFQLMPIHFEGRFDPFDPVANARYAYELSSGGTDWSAWSGACA